MSRLILRTGDNTTIGGTVEVFGTAGSQTLRVLDGSVITFRSGFNTGGDIIRLDGPASNFTASITGSNVTLRSVADNITIVIPIGSVANTIAFEGGDNRSLAVVGGVATLGNQAISVDPLNPTVVTPGGTGAPGAGQVFNLTSGADAITGTGGNDTINGRISEFGSFDTIAGGAGMDTLVITGAQPFDVQPQPEAVIDGAFANVSSVERLILTGGGTGVFGFPGTVSSSAVLGTLAAAAGLQEVIAGGTGGQVQTFDLQNFDRALTVTGSANAETVNVNVTAPGTKTLNLGGGLDVVNVVTSATTAGSVRVEWAGAAVGAGSDDTVSIGGGRVLVNDEGTTLFNTQNGTLNAGNATLAFGASNANVFNARVTTPAGVVEDRGNFAVIGLGTSGNDTRDTAISGGNVYFNLGAGNDTITATASGTQRHFVVGGAGEDTLTAQTNGTGARIVALMGGDNDTVTVNQNDGAVDINLGDGTDTITFTQEFRPNRTGAATDANDVVNGGAGRDTLAANSAQLTAINNTVAGARQSVSGFEVLTVRDALAGDLTTGRIQAGFDTVTLNAGFGGAFTVTFDSGVAATLNLNASAGTSGIRVASAGTGTADRVTIANTAAAVGGAAVNAFNGQAINALGVERLVINTSAAGTATTQTIGGISGTPAGLVEFVGGNAVTAGAIEARNVDASGLTGAVGITANTVSGFVATTVNNFTGSAGRDTITLGAGRQLLQLGAGDDTVIITALNDLVAGTSTLNGGDGIDTIQTTASLAATLSLANAFNANNGGFEQLRITGQDLGATDIIRVDNLGVNTVISAGTASGAPGAGNVETVTFNAVALRQGQSLVVSNGIDAPVTVTAPATGWTADQTAAAIRTAFNAAGTGIVAEFVASGAGAQVVLTGTTLANQANLTVTFNNSPAPVAPVPAETTPGVAPVAAVGEVASLTIPNGITPGSGDTFQITGGGVSTFTFTQPATLGTGQTLANNIAAAINAANGAGEIGQAFQATVVDAGAGVFRIDIAARPGFLGARPDLALNAVNASFNGAQPLGIATTTQGANAIPGVNEVQTVTFINLLQGQSITVAGRTVTAVDRELTAVEVSDLFETAVPAGGSLLLNGGEVSGTVTGFTVTTSTGTPQTVLTATTTGNVPLAPVSVTPAPAQPAPAATVVDGVAAGVIGVAGTIVVQNLRNGGTLELTGPGGQTAGGVVTGTHDVRIIDAGLTTSDVLNIRLTTDAAAGRDYGRVVAANVETINVNLRDTGTGANTAASVETLNLDIAQATTLVVTGNNGLNLTHNAAGLTLFDASGVVGNSANDTAANLGVFFQSLNNGTSPVTIRGGAGNDDLIGGGANDTFDLTAGGSDLVQFRTTRAANGNDTINGFTGGTGANGDVLDLNGTVDVVGVDSNGTAAGIIFNATVSNTVGDLVITGNNDRVFFVTDGNALINADNVRSQITGATAQNGEILVADGASAYLLHASSAGSNTFNVYRVFDADATTGVVDARVELLGTVNMTNTFGDLTLQNVDQSWAPAP